MSLSTILATVEADFTALETWVADEAEGAASSLISLGGDIAKQIEPALFSALEDAVGAAVAELAQGASLGEIATAAISKLVPDLQQALQAVESAFANGVLTLLAARASAAALPAPAQPAS